MFCMAYFYWHKTIDEFAGLVLTAVAIANIGLRGQYFKNSDS